MGEEEDAHFADLLFSIKRSSPNSFQLMLVFSLRIKSYRVNVKMKAVELDEMLKCDHSNES